MPQSLDFSVALRLTYTLEKPSMPLVLQRFFALLIVDTRLVRALASTTLPTHVELPNASQSLLRDAYGLRIHWI